jgi:predicted ATPase
LLLAIAEMREGEVRAGMGWLQAAEFLYETRLFPDLEYTFKHALTHEVTYGSLLHDRRRDLHAMAARAIEGLSQDRRAEQLDRLAHHVFHGEQWAQAVTYLREAGARALARSAQREAITGGVKVEEGLGLARAGGERGAQVRALRILGDVLARGDRPDVKQAERAFRQALAISEEIGMRPRTARCHLGLGTLYDQIGATSDAEEHLTTALALFTDMAMAHWTAEVTRALSALQGWGPGDPGR